MTPAMERMPDWNRRDFPGARQNALCFFRRAAPPIGPGKGAEDAQEKTGLAGGAAARPAERRRPE